MQRIYSSNHLEALCHTLAHQLKEPRADVFSKDVIITQTTGMNAWLKTELASRNGILANCSFLNQDGFMAEIYQLLFGEQLASRNDAMKYRLFSLLDDPDFVVTYPGVAVYYEGNELRRFQLADKIADLFDQYQLYRSEMVEQWETGICTTQNPAENWQQWLWQQLGFESRASVKAKILEQMDAEQDLVRATFPFVSLFGITVYTQFHLDFFKKLAEVTTVSFYLCLPTTARKFENDLLVSYGTKAAELASMFNFPGITAVENPSDNLLAQIQNQILNNSGPVEWPADDSLQVNSCYTPAREAECLYNYLVDLFDKNRDLKPADILVMTTDTGKYAPYIKAVFKNAPLKIPFQISGAPKVSEDTITAAFEQIACFREDDLTSEKVVSLLEQKRIRQRFGIENANYVRSVVRKANIRFGLENRVGDDTLYVGWKYGLEKILLGYAMLTSESFPAADDVTLYPFRDSEASASYDLFRLRHFVEHLESFIREQKSRKTLSAWKEYLFGELLDRMIFRDDFVKDDRAEWSSIYKSLSFIDRLDYDREVSWPVFLEELKTRLFVDPIATSLNTGRVTISAPVPVRGIPFRVICFLGLDNDVFPRRDRFYGFDLMGEEYRMGDRSKKESDKYLFLDTLMAARDWLYLSYSGQSAKDNTKMPPSIVLDTLLHYLDKPDLAVEHPLHGFSPKHQKDHPRLFSYLYGGEAAAFGAVESEQEDITQISTGSFMKFFEDPVTWYFNNILEINYAETDDSLPETELFGLDNLQKWKLNAELLELPENDLDSWIDIGIKEGTHPLKSLGKLTVDEQLAETEPIRRSFRELTDGKTNRSIAIDLKDDGFRLTGLIDGVYDREYIGLGLSKSPEKNKVRVFLRALLLFACGEIDAARMIDLDGADTHLPVFSRELALERISELLSFYRKGMQSPLKFTLNAAKLSRTNNFSLVGVLKKIMDESKDINYSKIPPNPYIQILLQENYFDGLTDNDLEDIRNLATLLNI
jgi:exodeoxyribonuclease V gamma subunit